MKVLIVDDHEGFRTLARALLQAEGFDVVGEAADGESAVQAAHALGPDLVLLDVQLPDVDGFDVARRLAAEGARAGVVLTSTRSASDYGARLRHTPALGFVPKDGLSGAALNALVPGVA